MILTLNTAVSPFSISLINDEGRVHMEWIQTDAYRALENIMEYHIIPTHPGIKNPVRAIPSF